MWINGNYQRVFPLSHVIFPFSWWTRLFDPWDTSSSLRHNHPEPLWDSRGANLPRPVHSDDPRRWNCAAWVLVGGWTLPLWNRLEFVSWDDYDNMAKSNMFQTTNQFWDGWEMPPEMGRFISIAQAGIELMEHAQQARVVILNLANNQGLFTLQTFPKTGSTLL